MSQLPPTIPVAESADDDEFRIEMLNEKPDSLYAFYGFGVGLILLTIFMIWQMEEQRRGSGLAVLIFLVILVPIYAVLILGCILPIWFGLIEASIERRVLIGSLGLIPALLLGAAGVYHFLIWMIVAASIFWLMRLLGWRITKAIKMFHSPYSDTNFILIPLDLDWQQITQFHNWHKERQSIKWPFLEYLHIPRFTIMRILVVYLIIAIILTFLKYLDLHANLPAKFGTATDSFTMMIFYITMLFLILFTTLRRRKVLWFYASSLAVVWIGLFITIFISTTEDVINLEADLNQTMLYFGSVAAGFTIACLWFLILRARGYRLVRFPPGRFMKPTNDGVLPTY